MQCGYVTGKRTERKRFGEVLHRLGRVAIEVPFSKERLVGFAITKLFNNELFVLFFSCFSVVFQLFFCCYSVVFQLVFSWLLVGF